MITYRVPRGIDPIGANKGVAVDQEYLSIRFPDYHVRGRLRSLLLNPTLRAAFLFRATAAGGATGLIARNTLMALHGCDVSSGACFLGALYLPHPVGIVIGRGVSIGHRVSIFQGVTIGADRRNRYPCIGDDAVIYPNAVIVGDAHIGAGAVIGAGAFVSSDVKPRDVVLGRPS